MAVHVAEQVLNALFDQPLVSAVNMPVIPPETMDAVAPFVPLMRTMGSLYSQIFNGQIEQIEIIYSGEVGSFRLLH